MVIAVRSFQDFVGIIHPGGGGVNIYMHLKSEMLKKSGVGKENLMDMTKAMKHRAP